MWFFARVSSGAFFVYSEMNYFDLNVHSTSVRIVKHTKFVLQRFILNWLELINEIFYLTVHFKQLYVTFILNK